MSKVIIQPQPNGPYKISGRVDLYNSQGEKLPRKTDDDNIWLCRCGKSKNKPLCDGTHNRISFKATK